MKIQKPLGFQKTKIMINEKLQLIKWSSNYLRPTTIEKLRLFIEYYITAIKKLFYFNTLNHVRFFFVSFEL